MLSRFLASRNDLSRGDDPFFQLQRELSRAVDDVFRGAGSRTPFAGGFAPSLDVRETKEGLELTAELPGVAEADIDLSLDGETLTLRGEKKEEKTSDQKGLHVQERSYGSFQRSLRLPFAPEPGSVTASFDKGVLHVTLPRPVQAGAKENRIPIKGAGQPPTGNAATG
ncbi:Hsp20/alpha crystallin family protein [Roseicella aquatilis]|uniref:Hsp20/alpha crystallin family protein n=1 Tax=Roseicella aquatilis TaxID=2527868 RepID=A0A4R4DJ52_9PROT|nr:Hsp20/alpha crystallin family protein [Roseicella aquatilis]TCZ61371.1 Hsp20/alpha crystallin family protein [Roseicella aquatilis]